MTEIVAMYDRIRSERRRLGLAQAEMAKLAGISRAAQTTYESGRSVPDLKYLIQLGAMGVDTDYVLTGKTYRQTSADKFDWQLAKELTDLLNSIADEMSLEIKSTEKFFDLLAILYRVSVNDQSAKDNTKFLHDIIKMAA